MSLAFAGDLVEELLALGRGAGGSRSVALNIWRRFWPRWRMSWLLSSSKSTGIDTLRCLGEKMRGFLRRTSIQRSNTCTAISTFALSRRSWPSVGRRVLL